MYKAVKALGQNFLTDPKVSERMIVELDISNGDFLLEVGPGPGFVTQQIVEASQGKNISFTAVELDQRFVYDLSARYKNIPYVSIVEANVLNFLPTFNTVGNVKIVGSLPYYITSPIIHAIIKMQNLPEIVVLMIQKEVAEKIIDPKSNYLSAFVQTFFEVSYLTKVSKGKFRPIPKVDSALIKLTKRSTQEVSHDEIVAYENFLHNHFKFPRKMLNKVLSKEFIEKLGLQPTVRPHDLPWTQWVELFNLLK